MTLSQNQRRTRFIPKRRRGRGSGSSEEQEPLLHGGTFAFALLLVAVMGLCSCLAVYYHLLQVESGQGFKGGPGSGISGHNLRGNDQSGEDGILAGSSLSPHPEASSFLSLGSEVAAQPTQPPAAPQTQPPAAQQTQMLPQRKSQPRQLPAAATLPDASGCTWTLHENSFLGEFADSKATESDLVTACKSCIDLQDSCLGVTCNKEVEACSARRGTPYLLGSPSGEVSYTKQCKDSGFLPLVMQEVSTERTFPGSFPLVRTGLSAAKATVDRGEDPSRQPLAPGRAIVVVIAHNQPECLTKCLASILAQPKSDKDAFALAVSLDDPASFSKMEAVVEHHKTEAQVSIDIWHKQPSGCMLRVCTQAVTKISEHFKFALSETFARFEYGLFVENDLIVSPDFLWYFRVSAPLLEEDPTLFCISAWNDNGFRGLVWDERRLFRTDYFPGLGWMIQNKTWFKVRDIWPKFPSTGWDHWLRHGSGLLPRECVVPEVPRTHHFGVHGANVKKGSALARQLNNMIQSTLPPKQLGSLSYLLHDTYEAELKQLLHGAPLVQQGNADQQAARLRPGQLVIVPYTRESYKDLAKRLKISGTQPRTSHHGVVIIRHEQSQAVLVLVDRRQGNGILPEAEQWQPNPQRQVTKGEPGESCDNVCLRSNLRCDPVELENANNCAELKKFFPCEEGCGHQVGQEIPAYVHDRSRDTALQCLITDDAIPSCSAHVPATTRLCVCVPP